MRHAVQNTRKGVLFSLFGLALFIVAAAVFAFGNTPLNVFAATSSDDRIVVRFLIAHQPVSVFERSNKIFVDELQRLSDGAMTVEILTPADLGKPGGDISREEVYELMDSGEIHMSSMATTALAPEAPRVGIFSLPFLFKNYDTLNSFLGSSEGAEVLQDVSDNTRTHALAYTFSGGFRSIALRDSGVDSLGDLSGARIASSGGDIAKSTLESLGLVFESVGADTASHDTSDVDGVEVTYTRLSSLTEQTSMRSIIDTGHSVLVTMMLADDAFFNGLDASQQHALLSAAQKAAAAEREDSEALAGETREMLSESSIVITPVSTEVRATLREASAAVYDRFESRFGEDFLTAVLVGQR